ncbi:MAG: LysE family translocator [Pseudorhodoplanes sp.]|nr:Cysteine/O-acetylserine efflux protein [Pseudorhodoplanes sp.]MCL4710592.1 LysE family translocator [Pseudorhodoplanes sp.]GIK79269.1 MAG: lysine transporter LysE [Alphaproteobacteria bacterium]
MPDTLVPLFLFALAGAWTPGPNNIMVTASGQSFGLTRTWPHILGVTIGFAILLVAFGLGLSQLFTLYPPLHTALRIAGALYLLYLAWRIATASAPGGDGRARARPISFVEALLFQWVNVKGLTFAAGVSAAFLTPGGDFVRELAAIVMMFTALTLPSLVVYCLFGVAIGRFLTSERARRAVNYTFAMLVVLSIALLFV